MFVVLVGLADVTSRIADAVSKDALFDAFAPAAARPAALAVPAAQATTTEPFVPERLKVPSLGIDAAVEQVGQKADGSMGTPEDFDNVGWWSEGQKPGQAGNVVFAGHVNNGLTRAGVFEHLGQVKKGDYITVSNAEGRTIIYEVAQIDVYETDQAPLAKIFAKKGPSQVVLITCEGEWQGDERSFDKRLVVIARQVF